MKMPLACRLTLSLREAVITTTGVAIGAAGLVHLVVGDIHHNFISEMYYTYYMSGARKGNEHLTPIAWSIRTVPLSSLTNISMCVGRLQLILHSVAVLATGLHVPH